MKGMTLKKALLVSGIFLLSTFMLVQWSWSCDDDDKDKWDCDHHDKWDCQKHGKPCQPPKIQRVFLEYQANSIVFEIWGKNFDNGATPVVTLGGMYVLTVVDNLTDDNVITATLPIQGFQYGDYRLVVSTCRDSACEDKNCKDHGPKCKCKYCKDHCSKSKDKYCKDHEYICRCKDRYALTIPGPQGAIELKIESKTAGLPISETPKYIKDDVKCDGGLGATGGGFSCYSLNILACAEGLRILASEPLQDDKKNSIGWQIIATYAGPPADLTIYAICAPVK